MQRKFILFTLCLTVLAACGPMVRTARQQLVAGSVPATETATETTRVPAAVPATTATSTSELQATADWVWTYMSTREGGRSATGALSATAR